MSSSTTLSGSWWDDYCIVTEGVFHQVYPGRVLVARGLDVDDPASPYALTMRLVLFWPYGTDGKLTGEDSYSDGLMFTPGAHHQAEP